MAGEYEPLARPIFIYVSAKSMDKPEVKEFVEFYLKERRQAGQGSQVRAAGRCRLQACNWKTSARRRPAPRLAAKPKSASRSSDLLKRKPKE
jgi:phosphate transport system substrate-binding protein